MEKIGFILFRLGILLIVGIAIYLMWVNKGVIIGLAFTGSMMIAIGLVIWAIED